MLEELFTYTKLQNEDYKLQTEPVDIVSCVSSALVSFYNEFQEKGIEVQADFTAEEIVVACNAEGVQRIVQNVLKNILDHGSKAVEMTLKQENERVIFSFMRKFLRASTTCRNYTLLIITQPLSAVREFFCNLYRLI